MKTIKATHVPLHLSDKILKPRQRVKLLEDIISGKRGNDGNIIKEKGDGLTMPHYRCFAFEPGSNIMHTFRIGINGNTFSYQKGAFEDTVMPSHENDALLDKWLQDNADGKLDYDSRYERI